jgi:hypothetical protein
MQRSLFDHTTARILDGILNNKDFGIDAFNNIDQVGNL